ncbi:UNVERIFIED_CONTAM: hypothetical protein K2H54_024469 [Gekko kuhli]
MVDREQLVQKARLAEQAERYDDMAAAMKNFECQFARKCSFGIVSKKDGLMRTLMPSLQLIALENGPL